MSTQKKKSGLETLLIHGGLETGPAGATTIPIVQSSSFAHGTAEELEDIFRGRAVGQIYTRIGNPTTEALEKRLTLLEEGIACVATSSGMSAITTAVTSIVRAGDDILASSSLFGGTFSLFRDSLSNFGITTTFADPLDLEAVKNGINERTRLIFVETIGNPKMDVPDIQAIAAIAREAGVPLMVDATVTTPILATGRSLNADIVIHSTSKFVSGSGSTIGGAIVDLGTFNWNSPKFPHFENFAKKYRNFAFTARVRKLINKDFGACPAPMNSFLTALGLETLSLRMDRHCANALALAEFLEGHEKVKWVNYPGLKTSPYYETASKQFGGKFGGILTFGTGDKESSFRVINGLKLAKNLANIGDAKTLVIHPASTICADYGAAEKNLMGVTEDLIRVSVGIETIDDIIADFEEALKQA